uniref:Uncharacterized protein n=1 Tax=Rhizophora mucronata TaxID=61149 RepID=A0A2P2IHT0_RHIMU
MKYQSSYSGPNEFISQNATIPFAGKRVNFFDTKSKNPGINAFPGILSG